jgi:hypothetical protein
VHVLDFAAATVVNIGVNATPPVLHDGEGWFFFLL